MIKLSSSLKAELVQICFCKSSIMQQSTIFNLLAKQEVVPEASSGPGPFSHQPPILPPSLRHEAAPKPLGGALFTPSPLLNPYALQNSFSSKKKSSACGGAGSLIKTPDFCFASVHSLALYQEQAIHDLAYYGSSQAAVPSEGLEDERQAEGDEVIRKAEEMAS